MGMASIPPPPLLYFRGLNKLQAHVFVFLFFFLITAFLNSNSFLNSNNCFSQIQKLFAHKEILGV